MIIDRNIQQCLKNTKKKLDINPSIGIICGSGLGFLSNIISEKVTISYENLPGFTVSKIANHAGKLHIGKCENTPLVILQGRSHYYDGIEPVKLGYGVHFLNALGVKTVIITCAAGAINKNFAVRELMVINDHINMPNINPLRNYNNLNNAFVDMSNAYDIVLRQKTQKIAEELQIKLHNGIYAMMLGPSYETPAEIKMLAALGADAVGMSVIPEVITARYHSMSVIGLAMLTNMAAGIDTNPLSHEEVIAAASATEKSVTQLISSVVKNL